MSDEIDRAQAREAELLADALARHGRQAARVRARPAAEFCGEHLDDGQGCGEPIGAARLAALPTAQLCVHCQGRAEQRRRA